MLPQSGEILKARINPHEENIFAVKIGGENCEVLLYDLRSMEDEI